MPHVRDNRRASVGDCSHRIYHECKEKDAGYVDPGVRALHSETREVLPAETGKKPE